MGQARRSVHLIVAAVLSAATSKALWPDGHLYGSAMLLGAGLMLAIEANRGLVEWHLERRRVREAASEPRAARPVRPPRYRLHPNGEVFDTFGRYWVTRELWARRISEGRSPNAHHDFRIASGVVPEEGIPAQWGRVKAVCRHCGEERLVFHGVEMRMVNHSWCVDRDGAWDPATDVVDLRTEEV